MTGTTGIGNAGNIVLNVPGNIIINGSDAPSQSMPFVDPLLQELEPETGLFANTTAISNGDGGNIEITNNGNLSLVDGAKVTVDSQGTGNGGNLIIRTNSLTLENQAELNSATKFGQNGGNINLNVIEDIILRNNSFISGRAFELAKGGNLIINARFILGFPSKGNGNDIIATAEEGKGGNININARQIFNLQEGKAIDDEGNFFLNNNNDIDASSQTEGLDGTVSISTPDTNTLQTDIELPSSIVEPETLGVNACSKEIGTEASSFIVKGKGGIPLQPTKAFMADSLISEGETITLEKKTLAREIEQKQVNSNYIPAEIKPIQTSMGDIYPARGVIKTEDGKIILTAYATDNTNMRTPHKSSNCVSP